MCADDVTVEARIEFDSPELRERDRREQVARIRSDAAEAIKPQPRPRQPEELPPTDPKDGDVIG